MRVYIANFGLGCRSEDVADAADVAALLVAERRNAGAKLLGEPATVIGSYADNHHCTVFT